MGRVLVLGGGFGGIAASRRLRSLLGDGDEIILVDRGTHFAMGFRKTSDILGTGPVEEGSRPLADLKRFGIDVRRAEIEAIDPVARTATFGGETLEADAIVVALGAETNPAAVDGLTEHGIDWYSFDNLARARSAIAGIGSGRIAIGIFGAPYKCPPAPFELALLLRDVQPRAHVEVFSPLPMSLPVLGAAGCSVIEGRMEGEGIGFRRGAKATSVKEGSVTIAEGDPVEFDVLLAVPPHRVPKVVVDAGLAEPGAWVRANPSTLATSFDGVYAVGDLVGIQLLNGQPMPKSGVFAEGEGVVAAEEIAARMSGNITEARFEGEGACFLEVGGGKAMLVRGRFLAEPFPEVELTEPTEAFLAEKASYEAGRLEEWFGS